MLCWNFILMSKRANGISEKKSHEDRGKDNQEQHIKATYLGGPPDLKGS
jgi:hypothetical protein